MDVCLSDCLNTVFNKLMMEEEKLKIEVLCCTSLIYFTRIWRNNHELGAARLNRVRD